MFTDYRTNAWFCYVMSLSLFGICAYVTFFEARPSNHLLMYVFMAITVVVWLSMGHFNDLFFNFKTLLAFRYITKHLDQITYVGVVDSGVDKMFNFYLTSDAEFYNIQQINRLVHAPQFFAPIILDYRIGVTTEIGKGVYALQNHPFATLTSHYERLIHNHCIDLQPVDEGGFEERMERIDTQTLAKNSVVRKHTIDEVLRDLANG